MNPSPIILEEAQRLPRLSFKEFFFTHKGDLTLALSALVYAVAWVVLRYTRFHNLGELGVSVAEAALIGGLCDYIALRMIFEQRWYLPGSGVLQKNREKLINGIAATIENEWLTPAMIKRKLEDMDLVSRLGSALAEANIHELLAQPSFDRLLTRAAAYLESPDVVARMEKFLRRILPGTFTKLYSVLNRLGVKSLSATISSNLRKRIPQLRNDPELMGVVESAVRELGQQLHDPRSPAHELASRYIGIMVARGAEASRGQIAQMVRENLEQLDTEKIRVQIESKTRTHLEWIRVNGGIFGAVFGLMFAIMRLLAHHGTAIIAHLHLR